MASKTTLNARNLEGLGVKHLAQLLIEISTGNAVAKRRLRLALAGAQSPKEVVREVAKRLGSIARARGLVDWKNWQALVDDLDMQRRAITEQIAPHDPTEALSLLWRFMGLARPVYDRCDDSTGSLIHIFHQACKDMGEIAKAARTDPKALARTMLDALQNNGYGEYDDLITIMSPALGKDGLAHLKELVEELGKAPVPAPPKERRVVAIWSPDRTIYQHEASERRRQHVVNTALKDIADAQGDVDGFIAQHDPEARKRPGVAAKIARRLVAKGRAADALEFIERTEIPDDPWISLDWEDAQIEVLEALGRSEDAQGCRYACFERELSVQHLRAYLKRLPDFDDIDAEGQAMVYAKAHREFYRALMFFLEWPAPDQAAALLSERHEEVDGNHYECLVSAAEVLSERHPLAATLALRSMIDFALSKARSGRYRYAAKHLDTCARLARDIKDFAAFEAHDAYVARLKSEHGRKSGFWSLTES